MVPPSAGGNKREKGGERTENWEEINNKRLEYGKKEKVGDRNLRQYKTEIMLEEENLQRKSKLDQKCASLRKSAKFHTINIHK